jgi:hypothetical protein
MSEISFDQFIPKRVAPIQKLNEFTPTDRRVAPVPSTSQNLADYPRTYANSSLADKWLQHKEKQKPPADLDDPYNTNYKGQRLVNNPNVAVTLTPFDGQTLDPDLYGDTDEKAGGRTKLQNSAAARHPFVRLYGNIPRVLADSDSTCSSLGPNEHSRNDCSQVYEDTVQANQFYNNVFHEYRKIGFHNQVTPFIQAFLRPENIALLHKNIELGLAKNLQTGTAVRIDSYENLTVDLVETAMANQGVPIVMLEQMNQGFVARTISKMAPSLRHSQRFSRWMLEDQRPKYTPYPESTKTQKGEFTLDDSQRTLRDPANRFRDHYLRATGFQAFARN